MVTRSVVEAAEDARIVAKSVVEAEDQHDPEFGHADRRPHTFVLDATLVEQARREVGEPDVVRSIEAALTAVIDYQVWIKEVSAGQRDVLS
jgi:hypothetical protein